MTKEELIQEIRESGITSQALEEITSRIMPSIRLRTRAVGLDRVDLGATRIGGIPDLPSEVEWPRRDDLPLSFIAQIRLSDVTGLDTDALLPSTGWLCFFYDAADRPAGYAPEHRNGWKVVYFDVASASLRRIVQPDLPEESVFEPCALTVEAEDTLPDSSALITEGVLEPTSADFHAYFDLLDERAHNEHDCLHRLLGNPDVIQGEMRFACQFASNGLDFGHPSVFEDPRAEALAASADEWILLLQIDSEENGPGWMWGDCGRLFWWIRRQDLADRDFDHVWVVSQCN